MRNNKIILAMDNEIEDGLDLIEKTVHHEGVYGYKIGSLWLLDELTAPEEKGKVFKELKSILKDAHSNKKVILDMQKWGTDIPEVVTKQVNKVAAYVDELIVCPMGSGSDSLKSFALACYENDVESICVLEMTHPNSDRYLTLDTYLDILKDALNSGITSFVIPATKEPRNGIKKVLRQNKYSHIKADFYATGFEVPNQFKPMVEFGVTKFIVGRAVYEAIDPIKAIDDIYKEIHVT